jgi:hypothetical protein
MDLMIESLIFHVGSLGSIRLSDPIKSGPSVEKIAFAVISESSVGSSSDINSPVSFASIENTENTIKELDESMENLDLGELLGHSDKGSSENSGKNTIADFTTRSGGVSDNDESTWRSEGRYVNIIYQMCVIITEEAEDDNGRNNPVVNAQGDNLGNNHRKEREIVYFSTREWRMIMSTINHGMAIPADSEEKF